VSPRIVDQALIVVDAQPSARPQLVAAAAARLAAGDRPSAYAIAAAALRDAGVGAPC
jgi:hypothetical protein